MTGAAGKWYEYGRMVGIPPALDTDAEDVAWALQTAEALWKRNERVDAVVWLRRAAQAAGEADDDDRALALARDAAELADWLTRNAAPAVARSTPSSKVPTAAEAVDDLLRTADVGAAVDDQDVDVEDVDDDLLDESSPDSDTQETELDRIPLESERLDEPPTVPPAQLVASAAAPATRTFATERPTARHDHSNPLSVRTPPAAPRATPSPPSSPRSAPPAAASGPLPPPTPPPRPSPPLAPASTPAAPPPPVPAPASAPSAAVTTLPTAGDTNVRTAAETHAGMLDPWAEAESPTRARESSRLRASDRPAFEREEVVTSAPPIKRPPERSAPVLPPPVVPSSPQGPERVDLASVEALSDLPDDARASFARAAHVRDLGRDEEVSGFALALIVEGCLDLSATVVDAMARRLDRGAIVRSRGTVAHVASIRLIAASGPARVATWDERAVEDAFRTCPWVEHELRAAADRLHAEVGVTMGPLGERLDPVLRAGVTSKLTLRILGEHEIFATRGKPIPGLLVVGAGELELVGDDGSLLGNTLRAGEFLFPNEVLRAGPAPSTARAAKGGALILMADRGVAQELLVTCPPLLEIFAGG